MASKGRCALLMYLVLNVFCQCVCESVWSSIPHKCRDRDSDFQFQEFYSTNGDDGFYSFKQGYRLTYAVECNPCRCVYVNDSYYVAYCIGGNITYVPETLPGKITILYIRNSSIRALDLSRLLIYTRLTGIFITYNNYLKLVTGYNLLKTKSNAVEMDLSNNAIESIQTESFRHMKLLRKLNLSKNNITDLYNTTFHGAKHLNCLNLSTNVIQHVENGTFDHLRRLLLLDMSVNSKIGCILKSIKNLKRLEFLDIHQCNVDLASCKALSELTNLRTLYTDAFNEQLFYPEMKLLTSFSSLHFRGVCTLKVVNETFFENTPYLKVIEFIKCHLIHIDHNTFQYIQHLESWTIERPTENYNITQGLNDLQGLKSISLKNLALRYLSNNIYFIYILDAEHAKYLNPLPLETLDLTGNSIAVIKLEFFELLPKTLKRLVLNENSIYTNVDFLSLLNPLSNIVTISLSNQGCLDFYCKIHKRSVCRENTESCQHTEHSQKIKKQNTDLKVATEIQNSPLILSPNLKIVYGVYNSLIATAILCSQFQNNSLIEIDFSHGYLPGWTKCQLPPTVQKADLSHNFCDQLNDGFLSSNSSIEYLNIKNNFLGGAFINQAANIFNNQKQLLFLDISNNYIYSLPTMFFRGLINLRFLNASHNKFEVLNLDFSGLNNLTYIDFSDNLIVDISHKTRRDLEEIARQHPVFLGLGNNPLMCTCYGLELMKWLASTEVVVSNSRHLICKTNVGKIQRIFDLDKTVQELQSQCISKRTMIIICVSCFVFLIVLTTVSLAYKYRWRLRYFKSVALMKLLASKNYVQLPDRYKFDAYILYAEETRDFVLNECIRELEVKRGHRLCIENRDFLPGTYVVTNIVSAIQNSAATLAIITPDFYLGQYSEYGIKMSIMTEIFEKRSVLNLVILETTSEEDLSHDILAVLKSNRFTEYPPRHEANDEMIEQFWNQISQIIGKHT